MWWTRLVPDPFSPDGGMASRAVPVDWQPAVDESLRNVVKRGPHIKFFDGDRRGYVTCRLDEHEWRPDLRMVPTVSRADATATTFASFVVEDRRPGAVSV